MLVSFPCAAHRRQSIVKFANSIDCYSLPALKCKVQASLVMLPRKGERFELIHVPAQSLKFGFRLTYMLLATK